MSATHVHHIEHPAEPIARAPRAVTTLFVARLLRPGCPDSPCRIRNVAANGLMVETHLALAPETPVSIELRDSTRLNGSVAWYQDGRAGIAISSTIDLDRFLGGPTNEHGALRAPRFDVICPVRLSSYGRIISGTIENLSQTGARVALAAPAVPGVPYMISIPGLPPRHCDVRWCDGDAAGMRFVEPIAFAELARWLDSGGCTH